MDIRTAGRWLDAYFAAWESTDPERVGALFTKDARYWGSPFTEPVQGRAEIARRWVTGTSELRHHTYTVLAVDGDVVVAHWTVRLRQASGGDTDIDGILVLTFDQEGACSVHREWFVSQPVES